MSDNRDLRGGTYDPVSKEGNPQPHQVKERATAHEKSQSGADVRPKPLPGRDEPYPSPEGLRRERKAPLNKSTGRAGSIRGQ
jgi:hypothetical protein